MVDEALEAAPTIEKAEPEPVKKRSKPGCWQHPKLGYFTFSQKGKFVELTHETPDKTKTRTFTLKDQGNRLYWSTNNVVHAFVRDLQGMTLFINVEKGQNEVKLESCKE